MSGAARGHVPARLRALPRDQLGCVHLADTSKDKMDALLERYTAALRYGRRILEGDLRPHDATDAEEPRSKRTRLAYPTCSRCGMDLRRPYVCLTCAYTACFFRDPITDAAAAAASAGAHEPAATNGTAHARDGAEVGTSHIGLHLAEEAHPFGTPARPLTQPATWCTARCSARRATTWCTTRALSTCAESSSTVRMCTVRTRPRSTPWPHRMRCVRGSD